MNIFRRAFCRAFQTVFRMALPVLPYREPEKLGSISAIADVLKDKGIRSALLYTCL